MNDDYTPDWAKNLVAPIPRIKNPNEKLPIPELPNWAKQAIKAQEEMEIQAAKEKEEQEKRDLEPEFTPPKLGAQQLKRKIINKVSEKLVDIGNLEKYNADILADYIINYAEEMKEKYTNEVNELKQYSQPDPQDTEAVNEAKFQGSFRRSE